MAVRADSVEETRRRLVRATMQLHAEKGVLATTVADIASRADVATGTVYRHFPRVEDLVVACGQAVWAAVVLPESDLFAGAGSTHERVRRLIEAYSDRYERLLMLGMDAAVVRYEARKMPALADWMQAWDAEHEALARQALGISDSDSVPLDVLLALSGWDAWKSLTSRGMSVAEAAGTLADVACAWLAARRQGGDAGEG